MSGKRRAIKQKTPAKAGVTVTSSGFEPKSSEPESEILSIEL